MKALQFIVETLIGLFQVLLLLRLLMRMLQSRIV